MASSVTQTALPPAVAVERPPAVERAPPLDPPPIATAVELPPTSDQLPYDDGVPLESQIHRMQMNLLIDSLNDFWSDRQDFYAGGNMFLYFSLKQVRNNDFRGPDVFVALGVERRVRKSWVVWEEDGRVPDIVIELLSETTADVDRGEKKRIYERVLHVPEYFLFDPATQVLAGYRLGDGARYRPVEPHASGRFPSFALGLELGVWRSSHQAVEADWLRWFTPDGTLVATAEERAGQAEQRAGQAEQRAGQAEQRAGQAEQRAGQAEQRAGQAEQARVEAEQARVEAERRADDLAARLSAYERPFGPRPDGPKE